MARILVIEDNPENLALMTYLLGAFDHRTVTATDGAAGLEAAQRESPDLVICDLQLPRVDGYEVARRLREDPDLGRIPRVAVSALAMIGDRERGLAAGFDGYLVKPIEPRSFVAQVEEFLPADRRRGSPASPAGPEPAAAAAPAPGREPARPDKTILIVDDRAINREFLSTLLGYAGFDLLEAADGVEAFERIRDKRPDLVITDIVMPGMDGLELVQRMQADPATARLPVIFYTATYRLAEARAAAEAFGAVAVLSKPAEPGAILAAVEKALGVPLRTGRPPPAVAAPGGAPGLLPPHLREVVTFNQALGLRLATLLELSLLMPAEREPQKLLELACRAACDILGARLAVVVAGVEGTRPRRFAAHGMAAEEAEAVAAGIDPQAGLLGQVLADGAPRRLAGPAVDPAAAGLPADHPPVDGLLAVPLISGSRIEGLLYVAGKTGGGGFCDDDEEFAVTLAAQLAPAYGNLVLYDQVQDHARRLEQQAVERRRLTRIHAVLSGISSAIVRISDRDELLAEVCRVAVTVGAFETAWIEVLDPDTGEGTVAALAGDGAAVVEALGLSTAPAGEGGDRPPSRAAREGRTIVVDDVAAETGAGWDPSSLLARGWRSTASFPLRVEDRVAAVLTLVGREAGLFDAAELGLLAVLAGDLSFGMQYIEKERRLDQLAWYDVLTGLANERLFAERLGQLLESARRQEGIVAVMLIDLDSFTRLNDTLGRHVGDALLREVAARLAGALEEPHVVARVGGDDFAVAVAHLEEVTDAAAILEERIFAAVEQPFAVDGAEVRIGARAGVALFPGDGDDAATLFKNAEVALKRALSSGDRVLFYAPEISARAAERLGFENRLRRAIDDERLVLHYQPKLDTRTGGLRGVEALIRWDDPGEGLIPPNRFIPVLEESGTIGAVGRWAQTAALAQHRAWREAGLEAPRVAINVSAVELRQRDFAADVERALAASGVGPEALELEITESVIMEDIEATTRVLREISDLGVPIAIDDFGTGHSSLRYLARLPVESLKIDRSFIVAMTSEADSLAIVSTIISLAHSFGLAVVGEGVDADEQAKMLRLLRCDLVQGFLFSRPLPAAGCEPFLQPGFRFELP